MLAFLISTMLSLQPPNGWVKLSDGRILFQETHPEKGEIFQVGTPSKELHQLGYRDYLFYSFQPEQL